MEFSECFWQEKRCIKYTPRAPRSEILVNAIVFHVFSATKLLLWPWQWNSRRSEWKPKAIKIAESKLKLNGRVGTSKNSIERGVLQYVLMNQCCFSHFIESLLISDISFAVTEDGKKVKPTVSTLDCTRSWLQDCQRRTFNRKTLHKRLPILGWLPKYNSQDAVGDLVAGITVGLTVIPQALAYAGIAGLPVAVSSTYIYKYYLQG